MTIRVVLADDQELIRTGLRMVIDAAPDLQVVGEAETGTQAVRLVRRLRPEVVVMDIRMPGMDGIEATQMIAAEATARVVMLTTYDDDTNVYASLRAGASGFLVKDMALDDMITAIRVVVAAGDALIAPGVTRRLIAEFASRPEPALTPASLPGVTDRERQVLTLVGRGLSNAELAAELHISPGTAKTHVANLLTKLGARDRVQLVILAYEHRLITPSR
ncbi:response regulator transcription factor [Actinomadura meridiana]|uniref:Response regulator transcription factor n=1 Tax=Actinomadura meridiana TaxID=559626 RepID=A0ABP8BUA8_9ACTN